MPLQRALMTAWPLFFGLAMMMVGNGLQGTLLGVRATEEGFSALVTGVIMSMYYAGYMSGTKLVPVLMKNVGHIRVFTALAALASVSVLMHGLFVLPAVWPVVRMFSGFAYAGLYIVVESWLNHMATKETRGKILALYLLTTYLGMVAGQFLLNVDDPHTERLFILASIFISLSIVPIALSKRSAPETANAKGMKLRELWAVSPLGAFAVMFCGLANSITLSIGAVYAARRGFDLRDISTFMAAIVAGGVLFQLPIGYLSDRLGRRKLIILVSLASTVSALLCFAVSGLSSNIPLYICAFMMGGFSMTIYGLCTAYTNDHLEPHQYVAASSAMLMMNGAGAIVGPMLSTGVMGAFGTDSYFLVLGLIFAIIGIFAMYRATVRAAPSVDRQSNLNAAKPDVLTVAQMTGEN